MATLRETALVIVVSLCLAGMVYAQQKPVAEDASIAAKTAAEAIDQLVMANRIIANEGIVDALGHISIRNPENPKTFFIARRIASLTVTKQDIAEVDLEGNIVSKPVLTIPGETFIHVAIYKSRPDVNAIFHGHPPAIIPFTVTDIPMKPLLNIAGFIYQGVKVFDDYSPGSGFLISTKEDAQRLAQHLGQGRVQLMRSHGMNVVAESLPRVVACSIMTVVNATIQWQTMLLGKEPRYLTPEEAKTGAEVALLRDGPINRYWGYWTAKVRSAMPDMK
jgi:3-hydroxy-2-methylpyridine-4,5-dicarboxylate 4-decarboxylase